MLYITSTPVDKRLSNKIELDQCAHIYRHTINRHLTRELRRNTKLSAAVHASTSRTPAKIVFGTELKLPRDLEFGVKAVPKIAENTSFSLEQQDLSDVHEFVRNRVQVVSDKMKARYDRIANSQGFIEGELVLPFNPQRNKEMPPKLKPQYDHKVE